MEDYLFYDSKLAVNAQELQSLYRYTKWRHSRSVEGIQAMIDGTSLCFSKNYLLALYLLPAVGIISCIPKQRDRKSVV